MLARHRAGDITIDVVTDQTSAHDPLAYLPTEITVDEWHAEAAADQGGGSAAHDVAGGRAARGGKAGGVGGLRLRRPVRSGRIA